MLCTLALLPSVSMPRKKLLLPADFRKLAFPGPRAHLRDVASRLVLCTLASLPSPSTPRPNLLLSFLLT